jgi:hypothetical protein
MVGGRKFNIYKIIFFGGVYRPLNDKVSDF